MGDDRRFRVMTEFILENFRPCRVADIAGGCGHLSSELNRRGYSCVLIDVNPRCDDKRVKVFARPFDWHMAKKFDLLVGLHPDQATEEICRAALRWRKPTVIVPCCRYWTGIESHGTTGMVDCIEKFFKKNDIPFWEKELPMNGKNIAIVANC